MNASVGLSMRSSLPQQGPTCNAHMSHGTPHNSSRNICDSLGPFARRGTGHALVCAALHQRSTLARPAVPVKRGHVSHTALPLSASSGSKGVSSSGATPPGAAYRRRRCLVAAAEGDEFAVPNEDGYDSVFTSFAEFADQLPKGAAKDLHTFWDQLSKEDKAGLEESAANEGNTGEAWLTAAMSTGHFSFEGLTHMQKVEAFGIGSWRLKGLEWSRSMI